MLEKFYHSLIPRWFILCWDPTSNSDNSKVVLIKLGQASFWCWVKSNQILRWYGMSSRPRIFCFSIKTLATFIVVGPRFPSLQSIRIYFRSAIGLTIYVKSCKFHAPSHMTKVGVELDILRYWENYKSDLLGLWISLANYST